jgi:hypothetical protein
LRNLHILLCMICDLACWNVGRVNDEQQLNYEPVNVAGTLIRKHKETGTGERRRLVKEDLQKSINGSTETIHNVWILFVLQTSFY